MQHHHKTIHQQVEHLMRHRLMLGVVIGMMAMAVFSLVGRRSDTTVQRVYAESFSWLTSHMNHEHPTHSSALVRVAKLPTISGGWEDAS